MDKSNLLPRELPLAYVLLVATKGRGSGNPVVGNVWPFIVGGGAGTAVGSAHILILQKDDLSVRRNLLFG